MAKQLELRYTPQKLCVEILKGIRDTTIEEDLEKEMEDESESQNMINSLVHNCHPWGGCTTTGAVAPRGDGKGRGAPKPIPTMNRWRVIAPDDDEDYEPNNTVTGPTTNNTKGPAAAAAVAATGDSLTSWHHTKTNIVDTRKECGQASQHGHKLTCPEPGNSGQHVNFTLPKSLGEGGAGNMSAPKRSPKISYCYDAASYPLPTSNIPIKRGKKNSSTSASINTPYSLIIGCVLACTKADAAENAEAAEISNDDHAEKTQDTLVSTVENAEAAEKANDGVISYNSTISTCEKRQHSGAHCTVEGQCNVAERGPRAPDDGVISYNSAISTCEKCQHSGAHCSVERQCNVAERGPRAPGRAP